MEQTPLEKSYRKLHNAMMLAAGISIPNYESPSASQILKFLDEYATEQINAGKALANLKSKDEVLRQMSVGESSEPLRNAIAKIVHGFEGKSVHWLESELRKLHKIVNSDKPLG